MAEILNFKLCLEEERKKKKERSSKKKKKLLKLRFENLKKGYYMFELKYAVSLIFLQVQVKHITGKNSLGLLVNIKKNRI